MSQTDTRVQQISRSTMSLPQPHSAISHSSAYGNMPRTLTGTTTFTDSKLLHNSITSALASHPHRGQWPKDAEYVLSVYDTVNGLGCGCVRVSVFPAPSKMDPQLKKLYKRTLARQEICAVSLFHFLSYFSTWCSHTVPPK